MRLPGKILGALFAIAVLSSAAPAISGPSNLAMRSPLFGTVEYGGKYLRGWTDLIARLRHDETVFDRCETAPETCPSKLVLAWIGELEYLRAHDKRTQIETINRLVNARPYTTDDVNYGRSDYWATPLEFLANSGDCEDYALFKFFLLRRLGFSNDRLRIVFVREDTPWISHAVLAAYLEDDVYILDNQSQTVLPQRLVSGYAPLYSANETARWAHYAPPKPLAAAKGASPPKQRASIESADPASL